MICGGLTDSVARNTGKVGLRTIVGENDDVVGFVADDDLKVGGEVRIVLHPHTKLGVGGDYSFLRRQFSPVDAAARRICKEGIEQSQGFILRQTQIAILGVDEKKCLVR